MLDYAHQRRQSETVVDAVRAIENEPTSPRWLELCVTVGVKLVWPATFAALF